MFDFDEELKAHYETSYLLIGRIGAMTDSKPKQEDAQRFIDALNWLKNQLEIEINKLELSL